MQQQIAGQAVLLERIILENPRLAYDRRVFKPGQSVHAKYPVTIPEGIRAGGVPQDLFKQVEAGLTKACVDVVICTWLPGDQPAVLGLKRKPGTPYAGTWHIAGGALFAYFSISEFLKLKAGKECGQQPEIEAIIGVYRNDAEDVPTSVISPCYVATVPLESILQTKPADGHDDWRLFTAEDLDALPPEQTHWYPMHVWRLALQTMPPRKAA